MFLLLLFYRDPSNIDFTKIEGLILNIPSEMKFLPLRLNRKHWIAVREICNTWYNLDSKLDNPVPIGKVNLLFISVKLNKCVIKSWFIYFFFLFLHASVYYINLLAGFSHLTMLLY